MKSWVAATIIVIGFVVGGVAIIVWNWPIFWVGVGIVVVGAVMGAAVGIMDEVTEYGGGGPGSDPASSEY
jgi:hypothetical protein